MEILHHEGKKGEFYVEQDGERVALLVYIHHESGEINITHTEVSDKLEGQGVGKNLVAEAVKFAREKGLKIVPSCPFAARVMEKNDDFQDVLKK